VVCLPISHLGSSSPLRVRELPGACIGMLLFTCLLLPGTLSVWRSAGNRYPISWPSRLYRGIYLALKVALVQPIMLCGLIVQTLIVPLGGLGGLPFDVAFILVLRWVISDQQQRCPVCLRSLGAPVRIGNPSRTFLEWYGGESACSHGHGLLHVSEHAFSYSRKAQW